MKKSLIILFILHLFLTLSLIINCRIKSVKISQLEYEVEMLKKDKNECISRCERIINQNFQLMASGGWENFSED